MHIFYPHKHCLDVVHSQASTLTSLFISIFRCKDNAVGLLFDRLWKAQYVKPGFFNYYLSLLTVIGLIMWCWSSSQLYGVLNEWTKSHKGAGLKTLRLTKVLLKFLGSIVQRLISTNPGLNLIQFFIPLLLSLFWDNFLYPIIKL